VKPSSFKYLVCFMYEPVDPLLRACDALLYHFARSPHVMLDLRSAHEGKHNKTINKTYVEPAREPNLA
jgi:hypothetical protein